MQSLKKTIIKFLLKMGGLIIMRGKLQKITHTQVSNDFLDKYMNRVSGNAVKVFLAIARKTIGWHRETDQISDSQLQELTGLTINTIKKARQELLELEVIVFIRKRAGKYTKTYYEINYSNIKKSNVSKIDILKNDTLFNFNVSKNDTLKNSNVSKIDTKKAFNVSKFDTKTRFNVSKFDSTKEINIKKEYKESIELIFQAYPTRDWKQKYSTGKCQKNKNQIKALLKKYSSQQIISEINKYVEERKKAGLSIKTFSRFLEEFPEPEKEIDDYDFENMTADEVIKLGRA